MTIATLLVALIATTAADSPGRPRAPRLPRLLVRPLPADAPGGRAAGPRRATRSSRSTSTARPRWPSATRSRPSRPSSSSTPRARSWPGPQGAMPAARARRLLQRDQGQGRRPRPDEPEAADSRTNPEDAAAGRGRQPEPGRARPLVNPKPWETVVRIKMHLSDSEWGFGSGTIIHSTAEESIILTCAHIFRIKGRAQPTPAELPGADLGRPLRRPARQPPAGDDQLLGEGPPRRGDRLRLHQRRRPDPDPPRPEARRLAGRPARLEAQEGHEDVHRGLLARPRRDRLGHHDPRPPGRHEQQRDQAGLRHDQVRPPAQGRPVRRRPLHHRRLRRGRLRLRRPQRARRPLRRPRRDPPAARPEPAHGPLPAGAATSPGPCSPPRRPGPGPGLAGTYYRAQNSPLKEPAPAADAITLPPFDMVASREARNAPDASGSKPWQGRDGQPRPRSVRSTGRPNPSPTLADSVDPGARPGEAITTDLAMEPSPEARAFDRPSRPPPEPGAPRGRGPRPQQPPPLVPPTRGPRVVGGFSEPASPSPTSSSRSHQDHRWSKRQIGRRVNRRTILSSPPAATKPPAPYSPAPPAGR